MSVVMLSQTCGTPGGTQYSSDVATVRLIGLETARVSLSERFRVARETDEQSLITKHGKTLGYLVSPEFFNRAVELMGEPVLVAEDPKPTSADS